MINSRQLCSHFRLIVLLYQLLQLTFSLCELFTPNQFSPSSEIYKSSISFCVNVCVSESRWMVTKANQKEIQRGAKGKVGRPGHTLSAKSKRELCNEHLRYKRKGRRNWKPPKSRKHLLRMRRTMPRRERGQKACWQSVTRKTQKILLQTVQHHI